jgi:membrane protein
MHLAAAALSAWRILQWPVVLALMFAAFALVYYFAPNVESRQWHWISPGAVAGLALWLAASFGLRVYLHYFTSFNASYGSLGAVVILLLWFYLTGASLLVGGVINALIAELDRVRAAEDSRMREAPELRPQAVRLKRAS